ncbi:MAG: hypothetical protein K6G22_06130, partial [Lachnospiraceae bacterium]|nr:hypothetical protein [Lachnospiraceae bacterium]
VAADGKLTEREFEFVNGLLDAAGKHTSEDVLIDLIQSAANDEGAYEIVKEVRDHLNDDGVNTLLNFIAAVCSIDDRISAEEVSLIKSLL